MRRTYYFSVPDVLSSQEQEITRLTCIGWSNRQIAKRLKLKVEAVQVHLNGIFSARSASKAELNLLL